MYIYKTNVSTLVYKYILLVSFFFFNLNAFSQIDTTYVPFPTDSVAWNETYRSTTPIDEPSYQIFIFMIGETDTIDNKLYNIVYRGSVAFEVNNNTYIMGYWREENKIVYFKDHNITEPEKIYYNFNLNIGDTIFYNNIYNDFSVLQSIDSIEIVDGSYRKRYHYFSSSFQMTQVEGIGNIEINSGGILHPNVSFFFENENTINCVIRPNEVIFKNKNIPDHNCYELGLPITKVDDLNLSIFPNPFEDVLQINNLNQEVKISILSQTGKLVFKEENFNKNFINLNFLDKGIYFLKIENQYYKIVKM